MMETLIIISIIGVWGNLILQSSWFIWSYHVSKRKHFTDSSEIDFHDRIEEYLALRIHNEQVIKDRDELWKDFTPTPNTPLYPSYGDKTITPFWPNRTDWTCSTDSVPGTEANNWMSTQSKPMNTWGPDFMKPDHTPEAIPKAERGLDGKFDHTKIEGNLDDFFGPPGEAQGVDIDKIDFHRSPNVSITEIDLSEEK